MHDMLLLLLPHVYLWRKSLGVTGEQRSSPDVAELEEKHDNSLET